jgi:hypothetical protein
VVAERGKVMRPKYYEDLYSTQTKQLLKNLQSNCKACNGLGYIITNEQEGLFVDCECVKKFTMLRKYTQAGINVKHIGRDMEWFKEEFTEDTFAKISEIENGLDEALKINFLIYPANTNTWGASHIGNQIIKFCVDHDKQCAVVSAKHIMDLFFSFGDQELIECRDYLQEVVDVLLIDEFGTEYNSNMKDNKSYVAGMFNSFFMERKRLNKTTIIACNFPAIKIKDTYAPIIHDVIVDNFVGMKIKSKTNKKSEFDGITVKLKPKLRSCFDDLGDLDPKNKRKVF